MNRYRPGRTPMMVAAPQRSGRRFLPIVAVLLAVALAVSLFLLIPAMRGQQQTRDFYITHLRTSCEAAQREVRTLSRTSASSSAEILSRIRSDVDAMSLLTEAEYSRSGSTLVPGSFFTTLNDIISRYFSTLMLSGTNTANLQTELTNSLSELAEVVNALE